MDELRLGGSALAQYMGYVGSNVPHVTDTEYFRDAFAAVQECVNKGLLLAGHDISAGGMITALLEMCFANTKGGLKIDLSNFGDCDLTLTLFAENPAVLVQVADNRQEEFLAVLEKYGVASCKIGQPADERTITLEANGRTLSLNVDEMRDIWYHTSYELDTKQSFHGQAAERLKNYKQQPIRLNLPAHFDGRFASLGIDPDRRTPSGIRAAIIREKGTNGEREMAYALYLAGFDVKDVTMTDLISGRETLDEVNMIVFCGGFSNSDVLGSAKGWAGAFLYNPKAKAALERFYARKDTLSLGVCNGCQLMVELGLVNPDHTDRAKMLHNVSHKFESAFLGVHVPQNESVMFGSLSQSDLGIWVAHGEGRFHLPMPIENYNVVLQYAYEGYPGNPNGSDYNVAGICSADGRHLAMMPHLERAFFPWQNPFYPADRRADEATPWLEAFVNARKWVEAQMQ